jgi:NTE family protein
VTTRAIVLGGGGLAGIAWLLGVLDGWRAAGLDLDDADQVVGTSAGAVVGALLRTGQTEAGVARQNVAEDAVAHNFDMAVYLSDLAVVAAGAANRRDAVRRVANLQSSAAVPAALRRDVVAARLPVHEWPAKCLEVVAVAQETGVRVVFDRDSWAGLVDAVTASCAMPGVWPAVTIADRNYVDGGAHSATNADLAANCDRVLILVPIAVRAQIARSLTWERGQLHQSLVVAADEASLEAFGTNPLDPATRPAALAAGRAQGARSIEQVRAFWHS